MIPLTDISIKMKNDDIYKINSQSFHQTIKGESNYISTHVGPLGRFPAIHTQYLLPNAFSHLAPSTHSWVSVQGSPGATLPWILADLRSDFKRIRRVSESVSVEFFSFFSVFSLASVSESPSALRRSERVKTAGCWTKPTVPKPVPATPPQASPLQVTVPPHPCELPQFPSLHPQVPPMHCLFILLPENYFFFFMTQ